MKKIVAVLACAVSLSAFANDPHAGMSAEAATDAGTPKAEKSVAKKSEKKAKSTTETTPEGESSTSTTNSTSTTTKPKAH